MLLLLQDKAPSLTADAVVLLRNQTPFLTVVLVMLLQDQATFLTVLTVVAFAGPSSAPTVIAVEGPTFPISCCYCRTKHRPYLLLLLQDLAPTLLLLL
jgi:hypothetical protein